MLLSTRFVPESVPERLTRLVTLHRTLRGERRHYYVLICILNLPLPCSRLHTPLRSVVKI